MDFCFSLEPAHSLGIGGKLLGQDLQRHVPVQLGIGGAVHLTHAPLANLLNDFVMADGLAEHETPPSLRNAVALNAKAVGGEKAIKITLYLG